MTCPGQYQLVCGDGAHMDVLRNGEADLVLTSPPYFSAETEALLKKPVREQREVGRVRREIEAFARGLMPVYEEIRRVLRPGGVLVLQVKDLRYANLLITLAGIHRDMAETAGLNLFGRVFWHKFRRGSASARFLARPVVGSFGVDDVEEILLFSESGVDRRKGAVELSEEEIRRCAHPLWTLPAAGRGRAHPHQFPRALARRALALFTNPGDLVVDPFAGSGTALAEAADMGRRAVGYEIAPDRARLATETLDRRLAP